MDALLIEGCDFAGFPVGGQLSFARQMMKSFRGRLGLVGISTDRTPVGRWLRKEIDGTYFPFFAVGHRQPTSVRPLVPARLQFYLQLKMYHRQIMMAGCKNAFIQAPETLLAVQAWSWESLCYMFPGVENQLADSRYLLGKVIARYFEHCFFKALPKAEVILACADTGSINRLKVRGGALLADLDIKKFSTRVDTECFFPVSKSMVRSHLGIPHDIPIIVNCGRLNQVKGWDLLIKAFVEFIKGFPKACFYFVGDGESRPHIETLIENFGLQEKIKITGYVEADVVAAYMNSCDLCVVGSYREGWSLAMLEALACGKALVSTEVSGARDMIVEGVSGFIVKHRNPLLFAQRMSEALTLSDVQSTSLEIAHRHALKQLATDLGGVWPPLKDD